MSKPSPKDGLQGVSPGMSAFGPGRRMTETIEDQPQMRSVGMMSAGPMLSAGGMGSLGVKLPPPSAGFGGPKGFGPPKLGIPRPGKLSMSLGPKEDYGVKQEWEEIVQCWDVKSEDLEMVPTDFPLERTHREIDGIEASEVASRISDALRVLSIDAEYDSRNAKAKCKTSDLVKFRIRLYAATESGMPVVVEVQRRSGSASSFMRSCRAILSAAEGKESKTSPPKKMPPFKMPVAKMDCLKSVSIETSAKEEAGAALDSSLAMFRSKNLDSNMLGLENMCSLTDPIKTSPATALSVSKRIMLGDEIRDDILALLQRDVFEHEDNEVSGHAERLRHFALVLFANCLEMCSKDGCLVDALKTQNWFENCLVPSLIDEVKNATVSANNAFQAVRSLQSIVGCFPSMSQVIKNNGGNETMEEAHQFALQRHELLAEETKRFMTLMESV